MYSTVFEVIDTRSFSNLWYWIVLAMLWSVASHWVLGVPFDVVHRAGRHGGQAQEDLETIVHLNCNRIRSISEISAMWAVVMVSALLSSLIVLGFGYGFEFAQAVTFLLLPMVFVAYLSSRTATAIGQEALSGQPLRDRLGRLRLIIQGIGMLSIFVTASWGMFHNLSYFIVR